MSVSGIFVTSLISIHALREEGDAKATLCHRPAGVFLSTPSARRATYKRRLRDVLVSISIHALREEGDKEIYAQGNAKDDISIHALREEGDSYVKHSKSKNF